MAFGSNRIAVGSHGPFRKVPGLRSKRPQPVAEKSRRPWPVRLHQCVMQNPSAGLLPGFGHREMHGSFLRHQREKDLKMAENQSAAGICGIGCLSALERFGQICTAPGSPVPEPYPPSCSHLQTDTCLPVLIPLLPGPSEHDENGDGSGSFWVPLGLNWNLQIQLGTCLCLTVTRHPTSIGRFC